LREAVLPRAEIPEIVVGLCVAGVERDRGLVAARGLVALPEALEHLSEIVAAHRRVGPQRDGAPNEQQSGLEIPGLQRDDAEQMQRIRVPRVAQEDIAIAALRVRETAGPMVLKREREGSICADLRHRSCSFSVRSAGRPSRLAASTE